MTGFPDIAHYDVVINSYGQSITTNKVGWIKITVHANGSKDSVVYMTRADSSSAREIIHIAAASNYYSDIMLPVRKNVTIFTRDDAQSGEYNVVWYDSY